MLQAGRSLVAGFFSNSLLRVPSYLLQVGRSPVAGLCSNSLLLVPSYIPAAGEPVSRRWTVQQSAFLDSCGAWRVAFIRHDVLLVALPFPPLFLWRGVPLPVPYHASDADTDEPLSAQESHRHDVLFPSLFDDEGHLLWTDP